MTKRLIRAAALNGPLAALQADNPGIFGPALKSALNRASGGAESLMPLDEYRDAVTLIIRSAPHGNYMLGVGARQSYRALGIYGYAISSASNLWEALQVAGNGLRYFQSGSSLHISSRRGRCRVIYSHPFPDNKSAVSDIQYTIGLIANMVYCARHSQEPDVVVYCPDMVSGQLDRIFGGCREKSSHIGIVEFNQSALRRPMRLSDAAVSLALQAYLKSTTFGAAADQELTEIVRGLVSASMGTAPIALVDIAAILGIPSRTLQYSLRKSGMSFRRIVEHCRHAVARSDLALGKSVTETAAKLGYEHIQNFSAAFSAWEGTTPSRFAANPQSARKILDTLNT